MNPLIAPVNPFFASVGTVIVHIFGTAHFIGVTGSQEHQMCLVSDLSATMSQSRYKSLIATITS